MRPSDHFPRRLRSDLAGGFADYLRRLKRWNQHNIVPDSEVFSQLFVDFIDQITDALREPSCCTLILVSLLGIGSFVALGAEFIETNTQTHNSIHITWRHLVDTVGCGIIDGLEGPDTGVKRTYSQGFLFSSVLVIDAVSMWNTEVLFSCPGALEFAIHKDGASPSTVASPKGDGFHLGEMKQDGVFFLNNPSCS